MRLAVLASAAALVPLCLTVSPLAAPLGAQAGVAPACDIQSSVLSKELAKPWINFTRAKSAGTPDAKRTALKDVLKELGDKPERFSKNPMGYNYIMSQTLSMFLMDPSIPTTTTRGTLGFPTAPEQSYDIIEHVDSAFTAIVATSPNCAQEVTQLRQNEGWLAIVRKSLEFSNNGNTDSAVFYANQSLRLSKDSPYPYYVLAAADNAKGNYKGAIASWKKLVDMAGKDTSYKDMRLSSYFYLGMREAEQAASESGAEQKATAKSAANYLRMYMTEMPSSSDLPMVMNSLADALQMAGDSTSMPSVYKALIADPSPYDDFALTMGGVIATRANDQEGALKLFTAAVAKNPQARDALRNLSATYYARNEFDKMFPPLKALVVLDPNNSDAWLMHAYAAQGLSKAAKTPAEKKAWTDTLVKYSNLADVLPAKVEVTGFQRGKEGASVTISVEQQAAAAGNYDVTMEFLDAKGAVIATDTKKMGPIEKGARKKETFKTTNPAVMSFRYKPLG